MGLLAKASETEVALWVIALVTLIGLAVYLVGLIRAKTVQQEPNRTEMIAKFRESHSQGDLTDEEFRTIETVLNEHPREKVKDNGETG